MNPWIAYSLGCITIPALGTAIYFLADWFAPSNGEYGVGFECSLCGFESRGRRKAWVWAGKLRHRALIYPRRWHKQALAVWRVEVGRDPLTGLLIPTSERTGR